MRNGDHPVDPKLAALVAKVADDPRAMLGLARTLLLPKGELELAEKLCRDALERAPGDGEVMALAQAIRSRMAGGWYFTMVRDERRHALYAEALRKVLPPGCTVLDIGAGTGLFAMLAMRAGAGRVIACERNPIVAGAAAEIIERNGFSDSITVVARDSRELEADADLGGRADVLIWDNLANDLFGAGALATIEDARARLLSPGAKIVPRRCEVRVALVRSGSDSGSRMETAAGFDMTAFNRLRPTQVTIDQANFDRRSDFATMFDVDFTSDQSLKSASSQAVVSATGGTVDGIIQSLRFHLADGVVYDTGEDEGVTAFGLQYHALDPFETDAGEKIKIGGAHDRQRSWFWVAGKSSEKP